MCLPADLAFGVRLQTVPACSGLLFLTGSHDVYTPGEVDRSDQARCCGASKLTHRLLFGLVQLAQGRRPTRIQQRWLVKWKRGGAGAVQEIAKWPSTNAARVRKRSTFAIYPARSRRTLRPRRPNSSPLCSLLRMAAPLGPNLTLSIGAGSAIRSNQEHKGPVTELSCSLGGNDAARHASAFWRASTSYD